MRSMRSPRISPRRTLEFHYGKHHKAYVDKLNQLLPGSVFENASLEDIVRKSAGNILSQAAQAWNHTFYWHGMNPKGGGAPKGPLAEAIDEAFGSFEGFKKDFSDKGPGALRLGLGVARAKARRAARRAPDQQRRQPARRR